MWKGDRYRLIVYVKYGLVSHFAICEFEKSERVVKFIKDLVNITHVCKSFCKLVKVQNI